MTEYHETPQTGTVARRGRRVLRLAGLAAGGVALAVVFAFIFGFAVKLLWNWLMPAIFGLGVITFWQAFGLVLLAKILFGGHGHGHGHREHGSRLKRHFRDAFPRSAGTGESDEEAGPVPGNRKQWRHFHEYWREEGKKAFQAYLEKKEIH